MFSHLPKMFPTVLPPFSLHITGTSGSGTDLSSRATSPASQEETDPTSQQMATLCAELCADSEATGYQIHANTLICIYIICVYIIFICTWNIENRKKNIIWQEKEGALSIEFLLDIYTINQMDSHVDTIRSNLVDESRKNDEIQSTRLSVCLIHNCGSTKATNGAVHSSLFPECFAEIMVRVPELTRLQLSKASISVYPKSWQNGAESSQKTTT